MGADDRRVSYNGWPTYETWLVHLWLTNEPETDALCRELVCGESTLVEAGEALKTYVEESSPLADVPGLQSGLYADLADAALSHVDWHEIAKHFVEDDASSRRQGRW
jgi:hypothetical protein